MVSKDNKNIDLSAHGKIGEAISQAKRTMFTSHKRGMPLREASETFLLDIKRRLSELIPESEIVDIATQTEGAEACKPIEPYYDAVQKGVEYMSKRLQAGDDPRIAANHFLAHVSHGFDTIEKPDFHTLHGYDYDGRQIYDNINRLQRKLSIRQLEPDHQRLDNVLTDLIYECFRLAESQRSECEQCEHCLRERYAGTFDEKGKERFTSENTIDDQLWPRVVERFADLVGDSGAENEVVVVLRHIESLAWVSRPGAIKDVVSELIVSLLARHVNNDNLREKYETDALESVKRSIKDCDEAD